MILAKSYTQRNKTNPAKQNLSLSRLTSCHPADWAAAYGDLIHPLIIGSTVCTVAAL